MIKLLLGFLVFAAVALFILSRGGDIDLSGESPTPNARNNPCGARIAFEATCPPCVRAWRAFLCSGCP